jgi:pimeloyl-ACP methyl ester carboxylesterase
VPHIRTSDGVQLYYEETGSGAPLIFMHEFGGHHLSWEPQVRYFSRRYRCVTYAARGWPPSDVPDDVAMYSQARAADDCADLMKALGIGKAHLCGLSMGATAALEFALRHPRKASALVIAAGGAVAAPIPRPRRGSRRSARASRSASSGMACRRWPSSTAPARRATPIAPRTRAAGPSSSGSSPRARPRAMP